jgi:hypothetical protein
MSFGKMGQACFAARTPLYTTSTTANPSEVAGADATALDGSGTDAGNGSDYLGPIWTVE